MNSLLLSLANLSFPRRVGGRSDDNSFNYEEERSVFALFETSCMCNIAFGPRDEGPCEAVDSLALEIATSGIFGLEKV